MLFPLLRMVQPLLHWSYCCGEQRVALVCQQLREAVRLRYTPAALAVKGSGCRMATSRLRPLLGPLRSAFGKTPGSAPIIIIDVEDTRRLDTVKRLVTRFLLGWSAHPLPGAACRESLQRKGGDEWGGNGPSGAGFTEFNILSCEQGAMRFADQMVKADPEGAHVRAAAAWLDKLGHPLVGGLGIQEKEKEVRPPITRVEWTAAIEQVAEVGRGCDKIYLISDRVPGVSVERILDEVQQLDDEMGHGWHAIIDTVSLDASALSARMLRRLSAETKGAHARLSSFLLRQQLLWDWREGSGPDSPSALAEAERSCGCLPPPPPPYVPLLAARQQEEERTGTAGHELLLEPGRSVVLVLNGEGESHMGTFGARTERGLRLTVFNRDWSERVNRTFDTWASIAEANALAHELSKCTPSETVVITSFDAWERCFNHPVAQVRPSSHAHPQSTTHPVCVLTVSAALVLAVEAPTFVLRPAMHGRSRRRMASAHGVGAAF